MIEAAKKRLLWIEDDPVLKHIVETKFSTTAYDMISVSTGTEAFQYLKDHIPDLIVLDLLMPGMDGYEFMQQLRANKEWGASVPVIILTNDKLEKDTKVETLQAMTPSYLLLKTDTTPEDVLNKINSIFS